MPTRPDRVREIDDPAALRALAHPLRLRLLASLRMNGPATASMLARRLGESSGATSYHLRSLARHGFVVDDEDAGAGSARERWWCAADRGTEWSFAGDDVERIEVGRGLTRQVVSQHARWARQFLDELEAWDPRWRDAAVVSDRLVTVTPDQLEAMTAEVSAVIERYVSSPSGDQEAERVMVLYDAFPKRDELA